MINNIIFDLDGTLLDTTEGIIESIQYTIKKMNFREIPYDVLLKFIGPPINESFLYYYGCSNELAMEATNCFRDYYKSNALLKAKPYYGIYELLYNLKELKKKMAVATYKREDYANKILKYFDFEKYFNSIHGSNEILLSKSDIVEQCLKDLNIEKKDTILIGDTIHDAFAAKSLNIKFIGITYGFGFKEKKDLESFDYIGIANNAEEILKFINK